MRPSISRWRSPAVSSSERAESSVHANVFAPVFRTCYAAPLPKRRLPRKKEKINSGVILTPLRPENMTELISVCSTRSEKRALRKLMSPGFLSDAAQPEIARQLGFEEEGICKGSFAARIMSYETKACGGPGCLRSMDHGGISAALQSIGAAGYIKDQATENLVTFQKKAKEIVQQRRTLQQSQQSSVQELSTIQLPPYFSCPALNYLHERTSVQYVNYRTNGYNVAQVLHLKHLSNTLNPSTHNHLTHNVDPRRSKC